MLFRSHDVTSQTNDWGYYTPLRRKLQPQISGARGFFRFPPCERYRNRLYCQAAGGEVYPARQRTRDINRGPGARPGPSSSKAAPVRFHRKFTAFPSAFLVFPAGVCYHAYHILLTKKFHMRNTPQGGLLTLCPIRKRIAIPAETATSAF